MRNMYIDYNDGYLKKPTSAYPIIVLNIKIKRITQLKHPNYVTAAEYPICYCIFGEINGRNIEIYLNSNRVRVYNYIFRKFDEKGIAINMDVLSQYYRRSRRDFIDELINVIVEESANSSIDIPSSYIDYESDSFFSKNRICWDDIEKMMK